MNCPNCQTINEPENVFCVNCGASVSPDALPPPTVQFQAPIDSVETAVFPIGQAQAFNSGPIAPAMQFTGEQRHRSGPSSTLLVGIIGLLVLVAAAGGFYLFSGRNSASDPLPDHLGLFARNGDSLAEVRKQDFTNGLTARDQLLKDDSLPALEANPSMVLYSDGKEVPVNDLRLIQLDSIKDDGSLKQVDFQAAPVEGKPEMKRLRVPNGLATGRYAFALLDGYLNEGKHKFWAFQVKSGSRADNGDALKSETLPVTAKAASNTADNRSRQTFGVNPAPKAPPPPGGSEAYSTTGKLVLRSGPTQSSSKIRNLYQGERVYIIEYSSNYESFKSLYSNFAYVQTEGGQRGWAYAAFLR